MRELLQENIDTEMTNSDPDTNKTYEPPSEQVSSAMNKINNNKSLGISENEIKEKLAKLSGK